MEYFYLKSKKNLGGEKISRIYYLLNRINIYLFARRGFYNNIVEALRVILKNITRKSSF